MFENFAAGNTVRKHAKGGWSKTRTFWQGPARTR